MLRRLLGKDEYCVAHQLTSSWESGVPMESMMRRAGETAYILERFHGRCVTKSRIKSFSQLLDIYDRLSRQLSGYMARKPYSFLTFGTLLSGKRRILSENAAVEMLLVFNVVQKAQSSITAVFSFYSCPNKDILRP